MNFSTIAIGAIFSIGVFSNTSSNQSQIACADSSSADIYELKVGQPFPNVVLPSLSDGSPLSVKTFRGQKLILHIWASW